CGGSGYMEAGGERFEFSVAIRTGVVAEGRITYHVGGGITYDSMAGAEYEECQWKSLVVTSESEVPVLLETMRYQPDKGIELLPGHLHRLSRSASYWDIPLDLEAVGEALSGVEGPKPKKVRLLVAPSGAVEVEVHDLEEIVEPVQLRLSPEKIDASNPLWFHKTADRSRYPASPEDGVEVLMMNLERELTETNISNLLLRFGDAWVTPLVESGCLPGVFRQSLIDAGTVAERRVTLDDLREADEIAVTNAVRGYRKAVLIE
ncbi:MAG: aminotransferase class IV, partial [Acidimicrobiia bacterium]|nr:aminotransferase class IV [Acidimicrobiia bacterium]